MISDLAICLRVDLHPADNELVFAHCQNELGESIGDVHVPLYKFNDEDFAELRRNVMLNGMFRGWRYECERETDDDRHYYDHYAVHKTGQTLRLDLSSTRCDCPPHVFRALVILGFPKRLSNGPLRESQIMELYVNRNKEEYS